MNYILTTRPEPQIFFYPRRIYAVVALPLDFTLSLVPEVLPLAGKLEVSKAKLAPW